MRHGVWSFSKWLEAWPKLPQYGAAYLVMNAVSMALTTQCLCRRTVIYDCYMSGLDRGRMPNARPEELAFFGFS